MLWHTFYNTVDNFLIQLLPPCSKSCRKKRERKTETQKDPSTCPKSHLKKRESWDFSFTAHTQETVPTLILPQLAYVWMYSSNYRCPLKWQPHVTCSESPLQREIAVSIFFCRLFIFYILKSKNYVLSILHVYALFITDQISCKTLWRNEV